MVQLKRMRIFMLVVLVAFGTSLNAQTFIPGSLYNHQNSLFYNRPIGITEMNAKKKWFFSTYSAVNTSFSVFKGGSAMIISAPVGLQFNRRLNNNLFAFAGVSAAPAYINFNRSFMASDIKAGQNNGFFQRGSLGLYSRAELGLQYVNDERTFSISGSIGIERSSNPYFPNNPVNDTRVNRYMPVNR